MWCPSCRADVAAELSMDNRRMLCARCQTELGFAAGTLPPISATPRTTEMERDARELLARWSAQNMLDAPAPLGTTGAFARPQISVETLEKKPEIRFDRPRSSVPGPTNAFLAAAIDKQTSPQIISADRPESRTEEPRDAVPRKRSRRRSDGPATHEIHSININTTATQQNKPQVEPIATTDPAPVHATYTTPVSPNRLRTSWSTLGGQLCAYAGVGLLTCGTVLVMWSYFGGPTNYMPTGWLVAAIGQMLLLLGVITLVSSGMEQTISEVTWRIDHLAEEIHHMGLALDKLENEHRKGRRDRSRVSHDSADDGAAREAA